MIESVVTEINGLPYKGWKDFRMTSQLQSVYSNVTFSAVEDPLIANSQWLPQNNLTIRTNDNQVLFVGRIDEYNETIEALEDDQINHTTTVSGRSYSAVLTDSVISDLSLLYTGGGEISLKRFIERILSGFDSTVQRNFEIQGDPQSQVKHTQLSEYNTVEKELRNGLLTMSAATVTATETGGFKVIVNSEYEEAGVINNFKAITLNVNETGRFHTYEVTNQDSSGLITSNSTSGASTLKTSIDDLVDQQDRITRVKSIGNGSNSQEYADWLNNTSFAKSRRINIKIVGWRNSEGVLYAPGQLVTLQGRLFEASKASSIPKWLIDKVTYIQSHPGEGTICNLSLIHPDAYSTDPRQRQSLINSNTQSGQLLNE